MLLLVPMSLLLLLVSVCLSLSLSLPRPSSCDAVMDIVWQQSHLGAEEKVVEGLKCGFYRGRDISFVGWLIL